MKIKHLFLHIKQLLTKQTKTNDNSFIASKF